MGQSRAISSRASGGVAKTCPILKENHRRIGFPQLFLAFPYTHCLLVIKPCYIFSWLNMVKLNQHFLLLKEHKSHPASFPQGFAMSRSDSLRSCSGRCSWPVPSGGGTMALAVGIHSGLATLSSKCRCLTVSIFFWIVTNNYLERILEKLFIRAAET